MTIKSVEKQDAQYMKASSSQLEIFQSTMNIKELIVRLQIEDN